MRLNLSIDIEDYKKRINVLRKDLDDSRQSGVLSDDFQEELDKLSQIEDQLLTELVPYYRAYATNSKKDSIEVNTIEQLGSFKFDSFLQSMLRINKNLFIASGINNKVQFFYLEGFDDSNLNKIKIEWGPPIKEIKENISFIYKLNNEEILLLGVKGASYIISINAVNKLPDLKEEIKVKTIRKDYDLRGFGRVLEIRDNLFVVEDKADRLTLFEIRKEDNEFRIIVYRDIYCTIANITDMQKICEDNFSVGTKEGIVYFIRYINGQFEFLGEVFVFDDRVRKLGYLEDKNGEYSSVIVMGDNGQCKISSLKEDIEREGKDLNGNLFDFQSQNATAIVLSQNGIVYPFEENFGTWNLNESEIMEGNFFTNVFKLSDRKYLLMDIKGQFNLLSIDGIYTPEDLWHVPIY